MSVVKIFVPCVLPPETKQLLLNYSSKYQIIIVETQHLSTDDLVSHLERDAYSGVLINLADRMSRDTLQIAAFQGKLKVISTMSVGYDHIDVFAAKQLGIKVGAVKGVLTDTTADLAIALLLCTARKLPSAISSVKEGTWGEWKPLNYCGKDINGCTVGIVGLGRIGFAVAKRLLGFNCKIIYSGPHRKINLEESLQGARYVSFEQLLQESDVVLPQCPLNPETRHLFDRKAFSIMKSDSIFINTTRGAVVDQDALYTALTKGEIQAAGLDVTSPEPLPPNHPLLDLPNCVVLPHIGSASTSTRVEMANVAVKMLVAGLGLDIEAGESGYFVV